MIVIYIDSEGTAQKVSPSQVYEGSNQSVVTVFANVPTTTAMSIAFKLPDGTKTAYYPMTFIQNPDGLSQYEFTLNSSITQKRGQAAIALMSIFSDGHQTSQLIKFEIQESILPELPPSIDESAYEIIKQYLQKDRTDIIALQSQQADIQEVADNAMQASQNAVNTANEAKATADSLAGSITQANETASQALDTANSANEKSDNAVTTANEAKTTADGLADSIAQANTTAGEAKEIAEEALEQSKVTGTKVNVDGAFQSDLNFDSNPQEQLNDLKSADTALQNSKVNKSGDTMTGNLTITRPGLQPGVYVQTGSKWISLSYTADGKNRGLYDQATNSWFIYMDENGRRHYAENEFAQELRGRKSVAISNNLVNEVSGFYEDPFEQYSKYIVCGDGGDKFLLGWQYGDKRIHAKVYNSGGLQYDGTIPYIETSKLEPTTANGWTVGDKKLAIPGDGVYLLSIANGDSDVGVFGGMPFIMILRGVDALGIKNYVGVGITTDTSLAIGSPTLVTYKGLEKDGVISGNWSAERLNASFPSIDIGSVAYKKLA